MDAGQIDSTKDEAEVAAEQKMIREEEERIRAKYPQKQSACALAQRRLAQAQSKKFFDSGDYNMAKATLKNTKLKKSGVAEPNGDQKSAVSDSSSPNETEVAATVTDVAKSDEPDCAREPAAKSEEKPKMRMAGVEAECETMPAEEAQRVVEHPPPSVLLQPPPESSGTGRPVSSLVEGDWSRDRRLHASTTSASGGASDGEAEGEREKPHVFMRHRHMTVSGVDAAALHAHSTSASANVEVAGAGLGVAAPNAVPMRRVSLLQRQNRGVLNVS